MKTALWHPSEERKQQANLTQFMDLVNHHYGRNFSSYAELHMWSAEIIPEFWNDPSGQQYEDAYFDVYPGVWRHGDAIVQHSDTGGITFMGRSDSTLKPSGCASVRRRSTTRSRSCQRSPTVW